MPTYKYTTSYYYGYLKWFDENKNKEINICEEDILHGSLGSGKKSELILQNDHKKILVLTEFPDVSEIDTFAVFFGGR